MKGTAYRGKYFNREQVYVCGDYMDASIFPVFQKAGCRRGRCKPTSEIQARLNQKNAEKRLTRLVHNNFTSSDMALHLTYRDDELPADEAEALLDLKNFLRRLKRRYAKLGATLKYISCTEFGEKSGRVHHHLIMSCGVDRDTVEALWGKGYANSKRLQFEEDGVSGLTRYMVKDKLRFKRYNRSKNLVMPECEEHDGRVTASDVEELREEIETGAIYRRFEELYPGYELVSVECTVNNVNRGVYIHIEMRKCRKFDYKARRRCSAL